MSKIIIATLAYTISSFVLAILWHVILFEETYHNLQYFEAEPNFLLGLGTIIIQGAILSALYGFLRKHNMPLSALKYVALMWLFFWTSHVLGFMAKQTINDPWLFLGLESVYLTLQFGIYGLVLGWIFRK